MKWGKRALALFCVLAAAVSVTACGKPAVNRDPKGKAYFSYFDTVSYVYSYAEDSAEEFDARSAEVSAILYRYHQLFDIYHEYSGINNLCTINRLAGGEPVAVEQELIDFLLYARELYDRTGGEMNILLGAVLTVWHDCRTEASENPSAARLPTEAQLLEAAKHTDISLLEIDTQNSTVRLTDPEASIDVGALGKGYATQKAAERLEQLQASGYVLNIGGNICIIGRKPSGESWTTGVRDPRNPDGPFAATLTLADTSCVTSGNYERYYTVDGKRYHHLIDKDTLWPADYVASLTVITKDSGLADALSTALFCMPYEEGLALAESFGDVEVLWVFSDGTLKHTPGLADALIKETTA